MAVVQASSSSSGDLLLLDTLPSAARGQGAWFGLVQVTAATSMSMLKCSYKEIQRCPRLCKMRDNVLVNSVIKPQF